MDLVRIAVRVAGRACNAQRPRRKVAQAGWLCGTALWLDTRSGLIPGFLPNEKAPAGDEGCLCRVKRLFLAPRVGLEPTTDRLTELALLISRVCLSR